MSTAFIPSILPKYETYTRPASTVRTLRDNALVVVSGVLILALLAQVSIPLGFTPVPITGQTFGVALIALLWGRDRGAASVAAYLALGSAGLPFFADGASGLSFGPTLGYLLGMYIASVAMGSLADRGWTKSFGLTWLAALLGSVITLTFGLAVLSFFVPRESLLVAGLLPFLPGEIAKTLLASTIAYQTSKRAEHV